MIDRVELPQIPKERLPDFVRYIHGLGITLKKKNVNPKALRPIQKSVNKEKVKSILSNKQAMNLPIIVSSEGYVLDGHHRWLAHMVEHDQSMACIVCECSIKELLKCALKFKHVEHKPVSEMSIFGRYKLLSEELPAEFIVRKTLWNPTNENDMDSGPQSFGKEDDDAEHLNAWSGTGPVSKYTDYGASGGAGAMF